ncbi:MAG: queuosine precursor transporter [Rhodobacterales bacterium]
MFRIYLPGIISMAIIVVTSNILVQFLYGNWLTYGAFTYPLAFLVTDVMNRAYGPTVARKIVFFGFVTGVICSLIGTQIMIELDKDVYAPAVTFRIAIASGSGFLLAQLLDIFIFTKLKDRSWWHAPLVSSIIGGALDTVIFFAVSFSIAVVFIFGVDHNTDFMNQMVPILGVGGDASLWISLAIADYLVKLSLALLCLLPFRLLVAQLMTRKV